MSVCAIFLDYPCASSIDQRRYLLLKNRQLLNLVFYRPYKDALNTEALYAASFSAQTSGEPTRSRSRS